MFKYKQRIFYGLVILTGILIVLIIRLAYIQLVFRVSKLPDSVYTLQEMSVLQRERGVVLDSGRGNFYDRNGVPITGETISSAVLFPIDKKTLANEDGSLDPVARALDTDTSKLIKIWDSLSVPIFWQGNPRGTPLALTAKQEGQITGLHFSGIEVLPYTQRYMNKSSGMQWLGYLSELSGQKHMPHTGFAFREGAAGLEKTVEPLLRGAGPTTAYYSVDGANRAIPGTDIQLKSPNNPYYPLRLGTTIDLSLQRKIEAMTQKAGMKEGAVVLLDANNADVIAMVSRPFYNPLDIHPKQGEWNNKAVQAAAPGSIFKTVVAAAALEAGATSEREVFYCSGKYDRYGLSCRKTSGHGALTLKQAFVESCNVVFAELSERLTGEELERAARRLGLSRTVGWEAQNTLGMPVLRPFDHEEAGTVFLNETSALDGGTRAQSGIGQRDVRVTPLQAANMVVTLLNRGQVRAPRILESVSYANGSLMKELKSHFAPGDTGSIKPETAHLLTDWMREVVTEGTGKSLLNSKWQLAGKSGTAQVLVQGRQRNNQWFIGYGPAHQPKYAVAVLFQNMPTEGRNEATALFGEIMNLLASQKNDRDSRTGHER
ncbi:penicillin-binding protein 2 [Paenibacillus sp.]|jgi:cell division protein FtsI/penicillin-binding protein 2|uniref:peptidoglycan D,D-transpeptidase FtsI family protein n=1 Tax=Paenibacillus sp. TaxID=58172 RepID=UPI00282FE4CE|nr:penicillin-binding protein 2 [Paenibacillus sp.]MDR0266828.1 penicillin-binding protein 2 [Paenibacillus sp.]